MHAAASKSSVLQHAVCAAAVLRCRGGHDGTLASSEVNLPAADRLVSSFKLKL